MLTRGNKRCFAAAGDGTALIQLLTSLCRVILQGVKAATLADTLGAFVRLIGMAYKTVPTPKTARFGGNGLAGKKAELQGFGCRCVINHPNTGKRHRAIWRGQAGLAAFAPKPLIAAANRCR